jgi:hypothetical protein
MHREQCPDQTSTRLIRALKAEAQGPQSYAATVIQGYANRNGLIPSQPHGYQSTYDQAALGAWLFASYARLEVVEEGEEETDAVRPKTPNNVPDLEVMSHDSPIMEDRCSDATGIERRGSTERAIGQDTGPLDTVALDDSEGYTISRTISKLNVSPTPKPVIQNHTLNSPPSGL